MTAFEYDLPDDMRDDGEARYERDMAAEHVEAREDRLREERAHRTDWKIKMSQERLGLNNPNFRHGRRIGQHDRQLVRAFNLEVKGEDCCRLCGSRENVQPHHAIPRSIGTAESRLNILNCLPLCASHHTAWHQYGVLITRDVFTDEEWAYLTSVQLTGRETMAWLDDRYPPPGAVLTCPNGHPRNEENTYVYDKTGAKQCRACKRVGRPDLDTHCPQGHEYAVYGVYWRNGPTPGRKYRVCKECSRLQNLKRRRKVAA